MINLADVATPIEKWGRDHWTTLLYLETRVVDHKGYVDDRQMRGRDPEYPTRLKGYDRSKPETFIEMHSDYDCVFDMVAHGLVVHVAEDVEDYRGHDERYQLTDRGWAVAHALRRHLGLGHGVSTFAPAVEP